MHFDNFADIKWISKVGAAFKTGELIKDIKFNQIQMVGTVLALMIANIKRVSQVFERFKSTDML